MIHLRKSDLQEIAGILMLANTPKSLLRGLMKTTAVTELRDRCSHEELLTYYDRITEKAGRSPFVTALAYCVLIALLTKASTSADQPDPTRLEWGSFIADYLRKGFPVTERRIFTSESPKPPPTKPTFVSTTTGISPSTAGTATSAKRIITV